MSKPDSVAAGTREAFDLWLSQHPISIGQLIQEAAHKAMREWLDEHSQEVLDAVSVGAAQK